MSKSFYRSAEYREEIQAAYTEGLTGWPSPAHEHRVATRHGETWVMESGRPDGPPLILLHGSGSSSWVWIADAARFGERHRVLAVDIPGETGRSEEYRADWRGNDFVEWMDDIYAAFGIDTAALVGISLGGWIATRWAVARPERVDRLALLCASGFRPPKISFLFRAVWLSLTGEAGMRRFEYLLFRNRRQDPRVGELFRLTGRGFIPRVGSPPLFSDGELAALSMPLLYLGGDKDVLIDTRGSIARIEALLPQARTKLYPEKGHALTGVTAEVLEFLAAVESPRGM